MKERPILFSTPMVQAILDGRKTQTRRIVKPQPDDDDNMILGHYHPTMVDKNGEEYPGAEAFGLSNEHYSIKCPYGQPGDRLWVKETFTRCIDGIIYKADHYGSKTLIAPDKGTFIEETKWTPSIHMPRAASRITLHISSIRVERLQDISEEDAVSEGYSYSDWHRMNEEAAGATLTSVPSKPAYWFSELWQSINGRGSWEANPWVWVINFEKLNKGRLL